MKGAASLLVGSALLMRSAPGAAAAGPAAPQPGAAQVAMTQEDRRAQLVDFPNLARYAANNAALPAPKRSERRVVFMGDSITEMWSLLDPDFFARAGYINRGIGGQTTPQMLLRFRQDVIALKPVLVHIMGGTNDIAGNTGAMDLADTEANIVSMVDLALANGIGVLLGSILPAQEFSWRPGLDPGPKIVALNCWLRDYAKRRHVGFIDYHAVLNDGTYAPRAELAPDGVHPSAQGYRVMDELAKAAIRSALMRAAALAPQPRAR